MLAFCKAAYTRYNRLSRPLDNRLYRVNWVKRSGDSVCNSR